MRKTATEKKLRLHLTRLGRLSMCGRSWLSVYVVLGLFLPCCTTAQTPDDLNPSADSDVYALAVQPDGRILVGGLFTTLGGQARNCIGRLNADGRLDSSFNPSVTGSGVPSVYCLAVQPDGKIVVGGFFYKLGGQDRNCIGRLNADGSPDTVFGSHANAIVMAVAVQADGKIVLGGTFNLMEQVPFGWTSRNHIGRLNTNGTLDASFNPGAGPCTTYGCSIVRCLALQADGKILVGGEFTTLGGQPHNYIGRLNPDGSVDSSFNAAADWYVQCVAVQADGKILVGGDFSTWGGRVVNYLVRLNTDGSLDTSFSNLNPGADNRVRTLMVQTDGKILVGGSFSTLGGQGRSRIGRLNPDGSLDSSFDPGANSDVLGLALQADGKIVAGGRFTTLGGQSRSRIGRLDNTSPATQELSYDFSKLLWQRGGSSPEVGRTTFEFTANGLTWRYLGAGSRVAGGWQVANVALAAPGTLRARGFVTGSSWFVESLLRWPPPRLAISQPVDRVFTLTLFGDVGETLELTAATNTAGLWEPIQSYVLTNKVQTLRWTNQSDAQRYFQAQPQ